MVRPYGPRLMQHIKGNGTVDDHGFETKSLRMERLLEVRVFCPEDDAGRILEHVCQITPLKQGEQYDCNAQVSAGGTEVYRPLEGAVAGAEQEPRRRPGIVSLCFELPDDQSLLEQVCETIFQVHSYQEPVIKVQYILACRSKGLDDAANPYRWWNTTGDWKKQAVQ